MKIHLAGLVAAMQLLAFSAMAATFYVAEDGSDSNVGTNGWSDALPTIGSAVGKAVNYDTILVSNGTYKVSTYIYVNKALDIRGFSGKPQDTIVNGNFPFTTNRCFFLNHTGAVVSAFTITNGCMFDGPGGGVSLNAGMVSNCVISWNRAYATNTVGVYGGGGVGGTITAYGAVVNSIISHNITSNGGGGLAMYVPGGYFLVSNCQIIGNSAITNIYTTSSGYGGGLVVSPVNSGYALITDCLIASNTSSRSGGGISYTPTYLLNNGVVANCIIRDNATAAGEYGGGVFMSVGTLRNCLFTGNTAGRGGGVYMSGVATGNKMLQNCTVIGNTNATHGGGVSIISGANPYLQNCIVWGNTGPAGGSNVSVEASSTAVSFSNCCTAGGATVAAALVNQYSTNNLSVAPGLAADYRLAKESPCVNAGVNQSWMREAGGVDLDRRQRLDRFSRLVDMGCYEYVSEGMMFSIH